MQLESSQVLGNLYHVIYTDIPDIGIFHVALWDMCEGLGGLEYNSHICIYWYWYIIHKISMVRDKLLKGEIKTISRFKGRESTIC